MILSVSRRTDIPNYYSEWFFNRIKEGYVDVRNPMNYHQVSRIELSPELIDCIVFWTKNPEPMLPRLNELKEYNYYFQFTLTGYGKDIEPFLPHKRDRMIPIFKELSYKIGQDKVILRYDPIVFTEAYTMEYHLNAFHEIVSELKSYSSKVIISYMDLYAKTKKNMREMAIIQPSIGEIMEFSSKLAMIAKEHKMEIESCAERYDLFRCGIRPSSCIDRHLIEKIIASTLNVDKDKNQRELCGCVESIDIGTYHTCLNGCKYCYANHSYEKVKENNILYDPNSSLLCSRILEDDKISNKAIKSIKNIQYNMFDSIK